MTNKRPGIYDHLYRFWSECERRPFSATAIALFHYLLHAANANRWQMPIFCHTQVIALTMKTSKQNVCKAREQLKARDIIDFAPGININAPASYTLKASACNETDATTAQLSQPLSQELSQELSQQLSLYNNKEKDKDNSSYKMRLEGNEVLEIEELKSRLCGDAEWQKSVMSLFRRDGNQCIDTASLLDGIKMFFQKLSAEGCTRKSEQECRRHFVNWYRIVLNNQKNKSYECDKRNNNEIRRGFEAQPHAPEDYDGAF